MNYDEKLRTQLAKIEEQIENTKAEARRQKEDLTVGEENYIEINRRLSQLTAKKNELHSKLSEVHHADAGLLADLKLKIEKTADEVESDLKALSKKLLKN